jgi:hypothetical protein
MHHKILPASTQFQSHFLDICFNGIPLPGENLCPFLAVMDYHKFDGLKQ